MLDMVQIKLKIGPWTFRTSLETWLRWLVATSMVIRSEFASELTRCQPCSTYEGMSDWLWRNHSPSQAGLHENNHTRKTLRLILNTEGKEVLPGCHPYVGRFTYLCQGNHR